MYIYNRQLLGSQYRHMKQSFNLQPAQRYALLRSGTSADAYGLAAPPTMSPRCRSRVFQIPRTYKELEEAVVRWISTCVMSRTKVRGIPIRRERELVIGNPALRDIWNSTLRHKIGQKIEIISEYIWGKNRVESIRFSTPVPPPPPAVTKSVSEWRELADKMFINYKRQVPGRLTDVDAKELNRRITASYAKMYLSRPSVFKWAGMAAFASAEVGRGMQQAWQLGFGDWGISAGGTGSVWIGGLVKTGESVGPILGKKLFWALSGGNRFVWWDVFWQHLAYRQEGIVALVAAHKAGELSTAALAAWRHIDTGHQSGDSALIWRGNGELLRYEQVVVLQVQVYDRSRDIWPKISDDVPSPIPEHGVKFTAYVPGGDIGSLKDRWKWIEESMLPAWRSLELNKPAMVRSLLLALG